jgi:hypothetical protein
LGQFFGKVTREHARARVVAHRLIAVGDYVCLLLHCRA